MKLLITRPLPDRVIAKAREHFDLTLREETRPLSRDELIASLQSYDIVLPTLGDAYSAEIFAAVPEPRAKVLANFGVGYNHIDVKAANAAGIAVSNTPGAVTDATADTALTLMLMTCRRAGEGERMVRAGAWKGWHPTQLLGLHMSGKTLGIVGMGRIGQAIARRAHFGFGMTIKYFNRSKKDVDLPAEQVDGLSALAGQVDILVVAVPGGAETHHLIDADVLRAMKPHAILVNIARGDVVSQSALIDALGSGQIAGAGLDVYEFEPQVPQALIDMENVTLLPHLGTAALEVREDMGFMALDNAISAAEGRGLPNQV
ncbi:D-glycerate dehydrogenase [Marivita sp. GX14005]|uniref:2-hydroxyacid dehydrogenase n=1 Tax=Marivita sp. GX14005 TaxID=2942276 RepID=UPI0020197F79|nr:D-glycerate dehydrogenase [Marivita sp. GX14005]MCL3881247.1 D-glycerate dehydrogenase [Marivita sp. GX14005]